MYNHFHTPIAPRGPLPAVYPSAVCRPTRRADPPGPPPRLLAHAPLTSSPSLLTFTSTTPPTTTAPNASFPLLLLFSLLLVCLSRSSSSSSLFCCCFLSLRLLLFLSCTLARITHMRSFNLLFDVFVCLYIFSISNRYGA